MKGYKFIEHTADVEFIAYGKDESALFSNSILALFDTIAYVRGLRKSASKDTKVIVRDRAKSIDVLLWYVLQDVLSATEGRGVFGYAVDGIKVSKRGAYFNAVVKVSAKKKDDMHSKLAVKGISRYNLSVQKANAQIKATVVIDV